MRHKALTVLQHITANPDITKYLFKKNVLPLILHELKSEPGHLGCRMRALSSLVNLSGMCHARAGGRAGDRAGGHAGDPLDMLRPVAAPCAC